MNSKRNVTDSRRMGPAGELGSHTSVSDAASRTPQGNWNCIPGRAGGLGSQHSSERLGILPAGLHSPSGKSPPGTGLCTNSARNKLQVETTRGSSPNYCPNSDLQASASCFSLVVYGSYLPRVPGPSYLLNSSSSTCPWLPSHR